MAEEHKAEQPKRRHERVYDLSDPREAELKKDNDRKKLERLKKNEEKFADSESISEMWARNSRHFAAEHPVLHERLCAQHAEIMGLEAEVDEIVAGVSAGKRAGIAHDGNTEDWPNIFPMPDACYADIEAAIKEHGCFNHGAAERTEGFRPPFDAKHTNTENWEHRLYGFHVRLGHEVFDRICEALILYALRTADPNLNWEIVNRAVDRWLSRPRWSPNSSEVQKLITQYRGEFKLPTRNATPQPEPIWRQQGFSSYREFAEDQAKKERDRQFLDDVLKHNQLQPPPAHPAEVPPTFFRSEIGS